MDISQQTLVFAVAASLPALLALVFGVHATLALMVNAERFLDAVENLLREGRRDRAIKLSKALQTPVTSLARCALELDLPRFEGVERGDYRAAPADDLPARISAALSVEARTQQRRMRPSVLAGAAALLTPLATPFLALPVEVADTRLWLHVASVIGVGSGLSSVLRYLRVRRQLLEVQRRLTPWVMSG